jgi:hypothetical protein
LLLDELGVLVERLRSGMDEMWRESALQLHEKRAAIAARFGFL